jgi:hypothetical protein
MRRFLVGGALVALLTAADYGPDFKPDPRDDGPGSIDVSRYPEAQRKNYEMFTAKCSKCHPLARSVNARFAAADWKRYMKRMIRRPNSGINEEQAAKIYEFLKYHASKLGL